MLLYDGTGIYDKSGLRELMEGINSGNITVAIGDTIKVQEFLWGGTAIYTAVEVSEDYTRVMWKRTGGKSTWLKVIEEPMILEDLVYSWMDVRCTKAFMSMIKPLQPPANADWSWLRSPGPWVENTHYFDCGGVMYPWPFPISNNHYSYLDSRRWMW